MSSFVGHSLTAGALFFCRRGVKKEISWKGGLWLVCLWGAAIAPDFDYFLFFLHKSQHGGIRVSNSLLYAMVIPAGVMGMMAICRASRKVFWVKSLQIVSAGFSHILLDYLVGVHPSPLFWPLSREVYASPVGVLPSAGALELRNYYLYRNLIIELGVLVPLYLGIGFLMWRWPRKKVAIRGVLVVGLFCLTGVFAVVAAGLSR